MNAFDPASVGQLFLYWAISSLVFVLTITLGFILFRTFVKLWVERQAGREGSRIQTKLVLGALALSFLPVVFLVLFSVQVLNFNLVRWFSRPAENIRVHLTDVSQSLRHAVDATASARALWLAELPQVRAIAAGESQPDSALWQKCRDQGIRSAWIVRGDDARILLCSPAVRAASPSGADGAREGSRVIEGSAMMADASGLPASRLIVTLPAPLDLVAKQQEIEASIIEFDALSRKRKDVRNFYLMLLALIGLFILFVASWIALFLSKQISVPISALLGAAREVRNGNLAYRVRVRAVDELATLVRAFNEMTQDLESNSRELERRRRFTEAILENIPTGVLSLAADGRILKANRAVLEMFPQAAPLSLDDLFLREDAAEIRYLMKRARRTGQASGTLESGVGQRQVSVIISSLDDSLASGFVMVIEDTTEMQRAQKAAAWQEVARRIAHEIKNPLTPISLCSDRMRRQLDKLAAPPETARILWECATTISQEVETVRALVDAFSQFSRFPVANPVTVSLNGIIESALAVFDGRLEGIQVAKQLTPGLPPVHIDPEQFKRVVVNLVDNAAEAMIDSPLKRLYVGTHSPSPDTVELVISDTGRGVSPEDREKLFLPYFSTKGRGTGLGLAIVNQIVTEHKATIRVEDNRPAGARFVVEIPAAAEPAPVEEAGVAVPGREAAG